LKTLRGQILEKAVRNSKRSITTLCKEFGVSQRHIYRIFQNDDVSNADFIKWGKILGYDFSKDVPELNEYNLFKEGSVPYGDTYWKEKYYELLEKTNKLLEEKMKQLDATESQSKGKKKK